MGGSQPPKFGISGFYLFTFEMGWFTTVYNRYKRLRTVEKRLRRLQQFALKMGGLQLVTVRKGGLQLVALGVSENSLLVNSLLNRNQPFR